MGFSSFCIAPRLAPRLPFYYGWVVVISVSIIAFAGVAFSFGVVGVLFLPMSQEFCWSRSVIPGAQLVGTVLAIAIAPTSGRLIDRHGPAPVITVGALVMVICLIGLAWTNSVWMFYVLFAGGVGMNTGTLQVALVATTAKWFVRRRGLASAVSGAGGPLGFVGLPVAALIAIDLWSWREAWIAMGVILFILAVPTGLLLLTKSPEDVGQQVDGDRETSDTRAGGRRASDEVQWTKAEALQTVTFWFLLTALVLRGLAQGGIQLHLVPHLEDQGFSRETATSTFLIGGAIMAVSGFFWGPLSDRIQVKHVYNLGSLLFIAYILLIIFADSAGIVLAIGILQGVTIGATVMIQRVAYANFFGRQWAGAIQGVATPIQMIGSSLGGLVAGLLYGVSGNYSVAFWLFVGLTVGATALMLVLPNPVKRESPTPAVATVS